AAGLPLERLHPLRVEVALPRDHAQGALVRGRLRCACRRRRQRDRDQREREVAQLDAPQPHPSSSLLPSIAKVSSGRQETPTRWPLSISWGSASFCRTTVTRPPRSSSTA